MSKNEIITALFNAFAEMRYVAIYTNNDLVYQPILNYYTTKSDDRILGREL